MGAIARDAELCVDEFHGMRARFCLRDKTFFKVCLLYRFVRFDSIFAPPGDSLPSYFAPTRG